MKTMAHEVRGRLVLVAHTSDPPDRREWNAYLDSLRATVAAGVALEDLRTLVFTDGGAPDTVARRDYNTILAGKPTHVAVIGDSPMIRGVVTAMSWFNPLIKAFSPKAASEALDFLGLAADDRVLARSALAKVRAELGATVMRTVSLAQL